MTTITLTPDLEQTLAQEAQQRGTTLEALALTKLRLPPPVDYRKALPPPTSEWQKLLRSAASDCGVSLTDEQVSRDSLYEDHL
jgi:hypothetical protein